MNRTKEFVLASACVASFCMIVAASAQSSAAPEAEHAAKIYMTAFFTGDLKTAAELTDPRTLDRIRETFLAQLAGVADSVSEESVLARLGLTQTAAQLKQMDTKSLYVALTEADHKRNPQVFEAMKRTRVEILGSAPNPSGTVTVRLKITSPSAAGTTSQETGLWMRQILGAWKVVGNAP